MSNSSNSAARATGTASTPGTDSGSSTPSGPGASPSSTGPSTASSSHFNLSSSESSWNGASDGFRYCNGPVDARYSSGSPSNSIDSNASSSMTNVSDSLRLFSCSDNGFSYGSLSDSSLSDSSLDFSVEFIDSGNNPLNNGTLDIGSDGVGGSATPILYNSDSSGPSPSEDDAAVVAFTNNSSSECELASGGLSDADADSSGDEVVPTLTQRGAGFYADRSGIGAGHPSFEVGWNVNPTRVNASLVDDNVSRLETNAGNSGVNSGSARNFGDDAGGFDSNAGSSAAIAEPSATGQNTINRRNQIPCEFRPCSGDENTSDEEPPMKRVRTATPFMPPMHEDISSASSDSGESNGMLSSESSQDSVIDLITFDTE